MKAALYARVSTTDKDQEPETQLVVLRDECERLGWTIVGEYVDQAPAGDYGRRMRWGELLDDAARRRFEVLVVYRLDRAFRSVLDGAKVLDQLRSWRVGIKSVAEPWIDTTTAWGEAMYHVSAVWGQLEQAIHTERTLAGMDRAQRQGTRSGVPIGRPRVSVDSEQLLGMVGSEIHSLSEQARSIGLNRETLRRRMAEIGYAWNAQAGEWAPMQESEGGGVMATAVRTGRDELERIALHLETAHQLKNLLDAEAERVTGLVLGQLVVVSEIGAGTDTVTAMGRMLGRAVHTMTAVVQRLEKHELITRTVSSDNRSIVHLALTDKGREVLLRWEAGRAEIVGNVLGRRLLDPEADDPVRRQAAATVRLLSGGDAAAGETENGA